MKTTLIVAVAVFSLVSTSAAGQSLGDIAKKAAADKAAKTEPARTAPPKKVYTDKDLTADPMAPKPSETVAPAKETTATAAPSAAAVMIADAKAGEDYWRGRLAPLRVKLDADTHAGDLVAERLAELRATLKPNMASLTVFGPEVVRLTSELHTWNAKIADDLSAIAALKEEGRQAGAFPGWFR